MLASSFSHSFNQLVPFFDAKWNRKIGNNAIDATGLIFIEPNAMIAKAILEKLSGGTSAFYWFIQPNGELNKSNP